MNSEVKKSAHLGSHKFFMFNFSLLEPTNRAVHSPLVCILLVLTANIHCFTQVVATVIDTIQYTYGIYFLYWPP